MALQLDIDGQPAWIYTGGRPFDAARPVMVFVHGAQNDHSVWALQSRYFAHHGKSVLAVDLPGHGRSGGAALESIEALADWLARVLDSLGIATATLIGHSMGSLVVLECAARHPHKVAALALIGAALPMRVSEDLLAATRDDEAAAQQMVNHWSHAALAHFPGNPGPGFWVAGVNRRLMQRQRPGVMAVDFAACNAYANGLAASAALRCRVLVVTGQRDVMTPLRAAKEMLQALPQPKWVQIEGAGHAMMAEKPDEVLEALRGFVG